MNKFYLTMAMAATVVGMQAKVELARDLESDFSSFTIPSGWVTKGVDAKIASGHKQYFPEYSADNAFVVLGYVNDLIAFTPNDFTGVSESNQWLISKEFEFSYDKQVVCVTSALFDSSKPSKFRILLSEGGSAEEDFTTELSSGELKAPDSNMPLRSTTRRVVVEGMKGKKGRIAMVATGSSGMSGFYGIEVSPYYINITNADKFDFIKVNEGTSVSMDFQGSVVLPTECQGMKAELRTSGGFVAVAENTKKFKSGKLANFNLKFDKEVTLSNPRETYTITITPNYEGAVPTVISGELMDCGYESTILLEEATSTGCGYCPYGFALLNFYQDKYNTDGKQRVIAAAYHDRFGKNDPMYVKSLISEFIPYAQTKGFEGYPWMMVNRSFGEHPANVNIEAALSENAFGNVAITSCTYDEDTNKVKVTYDAEIGFDSEGGELNVLALLTENNMKGTTDVWAQSNYLSGVSESQIAQMFGEDAVPYFKQFIGSAPSNIPAKDMVYDDIARNVYPSLEGMPIEGEWKKGNKRDFTMEFDLPKEVKNWKNGDVIVILTYTSQNGIVINSDRSNMTDLSAVDSVESDGMLNISCNMNEIVVNSAVAGKLNIFSADGKLMGTHDFSEGTSSINVADLSGMLIVKASAGNESKTIKMIVR